MLYQLTEHEARKRFGDKVVDWLKSNPGDDEWVDNLNVWWYKERNGDEGVSVRKPI